jgi:hypothetical protein
VTSSILYSSGSNKFGNALSNTQTFTGSVNITGSQTIFGNIVSTGNISSQGGIMNVFTNSTAAQPAQLVLADSTNTQQLLIGYNSGSQYGSIQSIYQGVGYKNLYLNSGGANVGIGTTTANSKLSVNGVISSTTAPSNSVGAGAAIYLEGGTGASYTYLQQGVDRFIYFGFNGTSWIERFTINNITGSVGIGVVTPFSQLSLPSGTGWNGGLAWNYTSANSSSKRWWINTDQIAYGDFRICTEITQGGGSINSASTLYERLYINASGYVGIGTTSPNATLEASGSIVSTTGQFGSTKSLVVISALNTYYQIYPGAPSGIFTARDNTNGGSGIWVMDPNGGGTLVSSNWINGTYSIVYNGNWQIQKTAGNVPVNMHCCLYGN